MSDCDAQRLLSTIKTTNHGSIGFHMIYFSPAMDFDSTKPSAYNGRLLTPLIAQLLSIKAPVQRNTALLTQDRRTTALSTFLGTFSSPYLTKFRVDYVSWMPLDPSFGFIFQSSLALEVFHTESLHLLSISLGVSQFTVGVSLSEYHSRSISLGVSHWRIYELRWILLQSQRTNIRLCLT